MGRLRLCVIRSVDGEHCLAATDREGITRAKSLGCRVFALGTADAGMPGCVLASLDPSGGMFRTPENLEQLEILEP